MNFFARLPPPAAPEPEPSRQPAWAKPETTLGATVAVEMLLARGDDAVVGVSGLTAYPNGFSFTLPAVLRQEDRRGRILHLAFQRDYFEDEPPAPEFMRLGVQFADGTAASNLGGHPHFAPGKDPAGPLLMYDGGRGGGRRYDVDCWL